jgi:hypothetical protein
MTNCRIEAQLAPHKSISKIITQYFAENDEKRKELDNLGLLDDHPEVVKALIPLLISKGIITEQELKEKANDSNYSPKELLEFFVFRVTA